MRAGVRARTAASRAGGSVGSRGFWSIIGLELFVEPEVGYPLSVALDAVDLVEVTELTLGTTTAQRPPLAEPAELLVALTPGCLAVVDEMEMKPPLLDRGSQVLVPTPHRAPSTASNPLTPRNSPSRPASPRTSRPSWKTPRS